MNNYQLINLLSSLSNDKIIYLSKLEKEYDSKIEICFLEG